MLTDFAGTYRFPTVPDEKVLYNRTPILNCEALRAFLDSQPSMRGSEKGYDVATLAFDGSGSPMETALALLLSLPVEMGGYSLERPTLNWQIPVDPMERTLASQDEMFGDICWPKGKVALEYDSWEQHGRLGSAKLAKDRARANSLTALGWRVLSVGYEQVASVQSMTLLARKVARLLGCELSEPTDLQRIWRSRLHTMLMPKDKRWI